MRGRGGVIIRDRAVAIGLTFEAMLLDWILLTSILGFASMGVDKLLSMGGWSRVRERTLWLVSLAGGSPGVLLGGLIFHHKRRPRFWVPVVIAALAWMGMVSMA
jgi:uncharacterized membrane protein YsdA (DUF1294 family)